MDSKMIEKREHFKIHVCNNCKLCNVSHFMTRWCWPKFVENRSAFLSKFVHVIVSSRGRGISMSYFRQPREFKKLFCDPDTGACLMAFDCQGGVKECFTNYYNQVVGVSTPVGEQYGYGCGWPFGVENDEDAFNEHVIAVREQYNQTRKTAVKKDPIPFVFTSTGKRFLNKVEKILEDRHKPKRRSRKSSTKTSPAAKRKVNTSKSTILCSKKGRKKAMGDSKTNKVAGTSKE